MKHLGIDVSTPQTKEILKAYDDNPDGKLDKQECAQLIRDIDCKSQPHELNVRI